MTTGEFKIVIGIPGRALNPNYRGHWGARAKAGKEQREAARFAAQVEILDLPVDLKWDIVRVEPTFYYPTRRKRDRDNCSAALKSARDGICDALHHYGFVADDSGFIPMPATILHDKHLPRVEIQVFNWMEGQECPSGTKDSQ